MDFEDPSQLTTDEVDIIEAENIIYNVHLEKVSFLKEIREVSY